MSWRIFKFFESEELKDPENTKSFNALLKRPVRFSYWDDTRVMEPLSLSLSARTVE